MPIAVHAGAGGTLYRVQCWRPSAIQGRLCASVNPNIIGSNPGANPPCSKDRPHSFHQAACKELLKGVVLLDRLLRCTSINLVGLQHHPQHQQSGQMRAQQNPTSCWCWLRGSYVTSHCQHGSARGTWHVDFADRSLLVMALCEASSLHTLPAGSFEHKQQINPATQKGTTRPKFVTHLDE